MNNNDFNYSSLVFDKKYRSRLILAIYIIKSVLSKAPINPTSFIFPPNSN